MFTRFCRVALALTFAAAAAWVVVTGVAAQSLKKMTLVQMHPNMGIGEEIFLYAVPKQLGYFAACYPPGAAANPASGPTIGGGQTLPIIVALAVVLVVLGGIPLAVMRRRGGGEAAPERTGERGPETARRKPPSRRKGRRR